MKLGRYVYSGSRKRVIVCIEVIRHSLSLAYSIVTPKRKFAMNNDILLLCIIMMLYFTLITSYLDNILFLVIFFYDCISNW